MPVTIYITGYLSSLADGESTIVISDTPPTVADALGELWNRRIALRDRVLTEQGIVRQHVNIFVNGQSVKRGSGLTTPLSDGSEIYILPAVSGG
jgi:molybdopterin synthase sulfur carrier subunit